MCEKQDIVNAVEPSTERQRATEFVDLLEGLITLTVYSIVDPQQLKVRSSLADQRKRIIDKLCE